MRIKPSKALIALGGLLGGIILVLTLKGAFGWTNPTQAPPGGSGSFNLNAIGARVYKTSDTSVSSGSWTTLSFSAERFDTDSIHSTSGNTSRLIANTAGYYLIFGDVKWQPNGGVWHREMRFLLNGGTNIGENRVAAGQANSGTNETMSLATVYYLNQGDYVELQVEQTSDITLSIVAEGNFSPEFGMVRLGQ